MYFLTVSLGNNKQTKLKSQSVSIENNNVGYISLQRWGYMNEFRTVLRKSLNVRLRFV